MRYVAALVLVLGFCGGLTANGQSVGPTEFDVASVKPALPERPFTAPRPRPGQWQYFDVTLYNLIILAHPDFRLPGMVVGGPEWIRETRFDLQARMSPTATHTDVQTMFQNLLRSRFRLQTHVETRTLDVFRLTLATPGQLGPGLTPARTPCVVWRLTGGRLPDDCDLYRRYSPGGFTSSASTISEYVTAMTIMALAPPSWGRSSPIDRPVLDKTGLAGYFQFVGGPSGLAASQVDGVSFFTLMEEQLGLKLTRGREPVDVLVIDAVKLPEPD